MREFPRTLEVPLFGHDVAICGEQLVRLVLRRGHQGVVDNKENYGRDQEAREHHWLVWRFLLRMDAVPDEKDNRQQPSDAAPRAYPIEHGAVVAQVDSHPNRHHEAQDTAKGEQEREQLHKLALGHYPRGRSGLLNERRGGIFEPLVPIRALQRRRVGAMTARSGWPEIRRRRHLQHRGGGPAESGIRTKPLARHRWQSGCKGWTESALQGRRRLLQYWRHRIRECQVVGAAERQPLLAGGRRRWHEDRIANAVKRRLELTEFWRHRGREDWVGSAMGRRLSLVHKRRHCGCTDAASPAGGYVRQIGSRSH
mmetsp:Transcript_97417/g.275501  ORF Transcript_97417/g.275501 Transcript_97417/m.275501 type:complete len:311 (-) Transcript_97417:557-1489(-)